MVSDIAYLAVLFVSYIGVYAGVLISHFTKEELGPGKRYFDIAKLAIFSTLTGLFFFGLGLGIYSALVAALAGAAMFFIEKKSSMPYPAMLSYGIYAIIMFELKSTEFFPIAATMIFVYGVLYSSIRMHELSDESFRRRLIAIMLETSIYPVAGLLLMILLR